METERVDLHYLQPPRRSAPKTRRAVDFGRRQSRPVRHRRWVTYLCLPESTRRPGSFNPDVSYQGRRFADVMEGLRSWCLCSRNDGNRKSSRTQLRGSTHSSDPAGGTNQHGSPRCDEQVSIKWIWQTKDRIGDKPGGIWSPCHGIITPSLN